MRLPLRIAIGVVATLAVIYVGLTWIAPVGLSYYMARKALPIVRVVPTELPDKSVSAAPGTKLSYFGYEFEVPWSDLDETQTKLYPTSGAAKCRAVLHFRSGLQMMFTAVPPHEWANRLAEEFHSSPQKVGLLFGSTAEMSDYDFKRSLYEFTPDKMHHRTSSQSTLYREEFVLIFKTAAMATSAESGIFNIQNQSFKGFQEGYPQARQVSVVVQLFSDEGSAEVIFGERNNPKGTVVSQAEINRVIQTMRKAPQE